MTDLAVLNRAGIGLIRYSKDSFVLRSFILRFISIIQTQSLGHIGGLQMYFLIFWQYLSDLDPALRISFWLTPTSARLRRASKIARIAIASVRGSASIRTSLCHSWKAIPRARPQGPTAFFRVTFPDYRVPCGHHCDLIEHGIVSSISLIFWLRMALQALREALYGRATLVWFRVCVCIVLTTSPTKSSFFV